MAAPIVNSDEELYQLTGNWEAAAALRDAQYNALNQYNASQPAPTTGGLLSGNILAGASWNSLNPTLAAELTTATGQETSNYAVGGATTTDTLNQLNTYINGGGTFDSNATVFLQTGGVDFLQGVDKATIKDNINQICKTLASQGVDVVLTGSPYAASINDVVTNNFDPKVDPLFNEIAKENKNVALVGTQGEILQNKKLLVDALHTNAEGTSIYNQSVIDAMSQFKNEVPSSTPQDIAQAQRTNTISLSPPVITQAASNPTFAQALAVQAPNIQELIASGALQPNQATLIGDTYYQPVYSQIGSGMDAQLGQLENVITYKAGDNQAGGSYQQYSPTGELERTGTQQKVGSFFGGLAEAFNDPVVQLALLGGGVGGFLGNQVGLTGAAGQAVGTGLFKGGAALAGGADVEDALKLGLLSGGLVYGGNALNNYLTTGSAADVGITERQFAIQDARQLADQGLSASQIRDAMSSGGYNDAIIDRALNAITPTAVNTPVTDGITITSQAPTSLNNVINTIAGTAPTVNVTAPRQVDQATLNAVTSQLNSNLTKPLTTPTVQVTGQKPATQQEVINAITATLPNVTPVQAASLAEQLITSGRPITVPDVIAAIAAVVPSVITPTSTIPTTTVIANKPVTTPETINTIASTLTPTAVTPTSTTTTTTKETDPLRVAQLALAAAGLLGAGNALSSSSTPTGFDVVPIPASFVNPPAPSVAPFTPLPPINFGNRNLLIGTQWEKFLDPNYGQVPEPVQYSQPSNLSYNDLMGILGSKQGMPAKSSLSINDIISGIQNQYGQAPTSAMG